MEKRRGKERRCRNEEGVVDEDDGKKGGLRMFWVFGGGRIKQLQ